MRAGSARLKDNARGAGVNANRRAKKCRKEKYRDYYIEPDGCRSVKPYKMSNCVGGGRNSDSCTAIKTKPRAVRFVCGDGRKFKKNVVAVRKCGRKKKVWG